MLELPDRGFYRSINVHNSNTTIVCDWVEASVLFNEGRLSKSEIVDALTDLEIYTSSDFAFGYTELLFNELNSRWKGMPLSYPFSRENNVFKAIGTWEDFLEYSFCLIISLLPQYKAWKEEVDPDYFQQGDLFEAITAFRLEKILPEWQVERYGWTRDHATPLRDLMQDLAGLLCERCGDVNHWGGERANDAGLDVLCVKTFPDERVGFFSLLIQCASGANWKSKLRDPNLNIWRNFIQFAFDPCKAVSIPYALDRATYRKSVKYSGGLLFDRLRLFSKKLEPIDNAVARKIKLWLQPAVDSCPFM
ncbi:hypothetical protein D3OALGA1CA_5074 [Olavius algarvensis associated proteobacterium Delta 3]|nr:hypothetical protein D3OALGA1CA_5074 [Olavius algarvensis associated proteobacterium Delta 3]